MCVYNDLNVLYVDELNCEHATVSMVSKKCCAIIFGLLLE